MSNMETCYRYRFMEGDIVLRKSDAQRHRYVIREIREGFAHIGMLVPFDDLEPLEIDRRRMEQLHDYGWGPIVKEDD